MNTNFTRRKPICSILVLAVSGNAMLTLSGNQQEFVFPEFAEGAVVVHDRYVSYDSTQLGTLTHQLCLQHILRDLTAAAELYPDEVWPTQLATEIRELIHRANLARRRGEKKLPHACSTTAFRACARPGRWDWATPPTWTTPGPEHASPASCWKRSKSVKRTWMQFLLG